MSDVASLLTIREQSQVGEARRMAVRMAMELGFNDDGGGRVGLVVTEAATNLITHAGGGELIIQPIHRDEGSGLEILSLNSGRGMENIDQCLQDGYSTAGTRGIGLGTLARVSDRFDIFSERDAGVVMLARIWKDAAKKNPPWRNSSSGVVCLPYPGAEVSGDDWAGVRGADRSVYFLADGLGHGEEAADSANEARRIFLEHPYLGPRSLLERIHLSLKKTRGAAVAIAAIESSTETLTFAGIGNIVGRVFNRDGMQGLVSHDGTLGYLQPRPREYVYPWSQRSMLIMHSDGLSSRSLAKIDYSLNAHDPSLIAGLLFRDCKRHRDDITVLVVTGTRSDTEGPDGF